METCFAFEDEFTAINKSIVCLSLSSFAVTNDNGSSDNFGDNGTECFFLYKQQFNRSQWYCGYIEAVVAAVASFAVYPLNAIAFVNFYKKGVSHEFLLLIGALIACNVVYATVGVIGAVARVADDYPLGYFGCIFVVTGGSVVLTMSLWTYALISYERRISATTPFTISRRASMNQPSISGRRFSARFCNLVAILTTLTTFVVAFNVYQFNSTDAMTTIETPISGVKNGLEPVTICVGIESRYPMNVELFQALYGIITLPLPIAIIAINYGILWRTVRRAHAFNQQLSSPRTSKGSRRFSHQRRREEMLALLMGSSVAQFVVCIVPLLLSMNHIAYDMNHGKKALSFGINLAVLMEVVDSAINPFWSSLIGRNKRLLRRDASLSSQPTPSREMANVIRGSTPNFPIGQTAS